MASETVGSLLVSLGFNSAEFDRGINKATQQAGQLSKTFAASGKDVALAANKMGVSVRQFAGNVTALRAQLDPAGTALANYRNQMNLLRNSYRLGAITQQQFVTGVQGAMATYRANGAQVVRTSGNMQMGMLQLGFQLNDVATQFASGTRPMQIFAQQSGQVVQAIALMHNGAGRFGAFLTSGWGMALTAGVIALSAFIPKLLDTEDGLDKVKFASDGVADAQGILGRVMDLTTGKMKTQEAAAIALARAQLLVAKAQAITNASKARAEVQGLQSLKFRTGVTTADGTPEFIRRNRRAAGLDEATSRGFVFGKDENLARISQEVLGGQLTPEAALNQLEQLRQKGKITATVFGEAAQNIANMNAELLNQKAAQAGLDALDGKGLGMLAEDPKTKKTREKKGKQGPTAEEIAFQLADERASIMTQYNNVLASMAMSAEEEAEYQLRNVEIQQIRAIEGIKANENYSAAQKEILIEQQNRLAEEQRRQVEFDKTRRIERETEQLKQQEYQSERDNLQIKMQMATTEADRQRLALELFDLEQREQRAVLQRVIASETSSDAEKARAKLALDQLQASESAARAAVSRQTETRAQAYVRSLQKTPEEINEAIDNIKIDGLERLSDGIAEAIVNFESLADVAKAVVQQVLTELMRLQIQQSIIGPLAGMLGLGGGLGSVAGVAKGFSASAGLQSSVNSLLDSGLPFFAAGTNFAPGGLAMVGEKGPELVNLPRGSQVIPNHELAGLAANNNTVFRVTVNGGGGNERQNRATGRQVADGAMARMAAARRSGII